MRNRGNIVVYAVCGATRQPLASADAAGAMAAITVASALMEHQRACSARGVPFEAKIVHEDVEANAHGQVTFSEYVELNPALSPVGEVCNSIDGVFNPPQKIAASKGGK